ncbi:Glycolipid transfer protein (GLTP) [Mactra antiquata]
MDYHVFSHSKKHDFDLELVLTALKNCPTDDGDVDLKYYLQAYNELCRFFKLTGRLFGFVAADLEYKITVLDKKQADDRNGQFYNTTKTMVQYELNRALTLNRGSNPSGSRTLLRLHWALEFILEFMDRIRKCSDHDKTSKIATEVYEKTLSKHHPWLTRKMAAIAVYLLPSRKDLISVMCKQDYETVLCMLDKVVHAGQEVYRLTENIYKANNLLDIP